jgi:hypothetical protein
MGQMTIWQPGLYASGNAKSMAMRFIAKHLQAVWQQTLPVNEKTHSASCVLKPIKQGG